MTRVLHVTDIHLRHHQSGTAVQPARLSRDMPRALEALAARIAHLSPDVVVMTGDILDVPDPVIAGESPDDRPLADWEVEAERDYQWVKDWADGLHCPVVTVPGNHDLEPTFTKIYPDRPGYQDVAGLRFFCFWDRLADNRQPERVGHNAELFDEALEADEHDCPQVHLQHYMIDPVTTHNSWRYDYKQAEALKRKLAMNDRVRAVLSGHLHPGSMSFGPGDILHSVAPAFCEAPHSFRVYEIMPTGRSVVTDFTLQD